MKVITNIKHLVLAFAVMAIGSLFAGPRVTIIGDSISTFSGSTGPGYETHYPANDVTSVEQTWWMKTITAIGGELVANAAWSGSHVAGSLSSDVVPDSAMSSDYRMNTSRLGTNPNCFMIFAGTNDARGHFLNPDNKPIGSFDATTFDPQTADRSYFAPAFAYMVSFLKTNYPEAEIWIIINSDVDNELSNNNGSFTDATDWKQHADVMKSVATAYDAHIVELTGLDGNKKYSEPFANSDSETTKVHPTAAGMTAIANQVTAAYREVHPAPEQPVNPSYAGGSLSITEKNNVLSIGIPAGLVEEGTKGAGLILAYDNEDKGNDLANWTNQYIRAGVKITPASQVVKIPRKELPAAIQVGMILKAFVTKPKPGYEDYTFYESVTRGKDANAYFLLDYYTNPKTRTIADIAFGKDTYISGNNNTFMGGIQNDGDTPHVNYSLSIGDKDTFRLWLYLQGGDYGGVAQNTSVGAAVIQQRGILDISNEARSWTPASGTTSYPLICDDSQKTVKTNTQKFGVFGRWESQNSKFVCFTVYQMRLYSLKFEEDGEIIHDYRVVRRISDDMVGLLDIKTDDFFAKQGTDNFGGLEIEVPCPVSVNADVSAAYQLPELEKTHVPNFKGGSDNWNASYFKTDEQGIKDVLKGSFTMSAWIRANSSAKVTSSLDHNMAIMGSGSQGTEGVLMFIRNNASNTYDLRVQWNKGGGLQELMQGTENICVMDDKWHHVATTFDSAGDGTFKLYLDGVKIGDKVRDTVKEVVVKWSFAIGGREWNNGTKLVGDKAFDGNIVEASLWNRALTDAEIAELKAYRPSKHKAGLVSFWPLWTDKDDSTADEGVDIRKAYPLTNTKGPSSFSTLVSYVDRDDFPFDYGYLFGKPYGLSIIFR